jgi:hypothetical protein
VFVSKGHRVGRGRAGHGRPRLRQGVGNWGRVWVIKAGCGRLGQDRAGWGKGDAKRMQPLAVATPSRGLSKPLSLTVLTSERFSLFLLLRLLLLEVVVDSSSLSDFEPDLSLSLSLSFARETEWVKVASRSLRRTMQ